MAARVARHQSSGFCSAQPGCGWYRGYSKKAEVMTCPSSAPNSAALMPVVPRSIPSSACICILPGLSFSLRNNAVCIRFVQAHCFVDDAVAFDGVGVGAGQGEGAAVEFAGEVVDEGPLQD